MGNKLVCCRWRWIESPEFTNNRFDENACKYSVDPEAYTNGIIPHNDKVENGYINQSSQVYRNNEMTHTNSNKPIIYENKYPTNYVCAAPLYTAAKQSSHRYLQQQQQQNQYQLYGIAGDTNFINMGTAGANYRDSWMMRSTELLQHISEREPEDVDNDPSINAKHPTLFFKRSKEDIEQNILKRRQESDRRAAMHQQSRLRPWSSCSSILLDDTTISQPGPALALKTLALAIHLHVSGMDEDGEARQQQRADMLDDDDEEENADDGSRRFKCSRDDPVYVVFDERLHPVSSGSSSRQQGCEEPACNRAPSHKEIYRYLRHIFNMAQLTPECAIVTLVYLERLISSAEMEILPWSWRRQVLASVLLASKVWDDQAVWNADYCQIMKELCIEDVNELERSFLELIQFNINVPASVYAHYYFDLLQLGRAHGLYGVTRPPLLWERALRLEALPCPAGPLDDHSPRWWARPAPLSRFPSWDSVCGGPTGLPPASNRLRRIVVIS